MMCRLFREKIVSNDMINSIVSSNVYEIPNRSKTILTKTQRQTPMGNENIEIHPMDKFSFMINKRKNPIRNKTRIALNWRS